LAAGDFTFADVAQVRVYLSALSLYEGMNRVYEAFVKPPYPARTTIEAKLIDADYLVEIEAIAMKT
jgi:enamine deaminase RidA (YjgF/YER057c/UK114 family)